MMAEKEEVFISIIICMYNMPREAPRTIVSALPPYQKKVNGNEYEVIVVDNGSSLPIDANFLKGLPETIKFAQYPGSSASPVFALNWAATHVAKGNWIAFCIDGARILSDGLVAEWLKYASLNRQTFIHTLGWHLGPDVHMRASQTGYNQDIEDKLLENIDWYNHPARLFEVSTLAGSSDSGFFSTIRESNAFVVSRIMLEKIGYFNEHFSSPGGGLANLEFFSRYVTSEQVFPICLLGEGTFHQYHGGVATSGKIEWDKVNEEYLSIVGKPYEAPRYSTMFAGAFKKELYKFYTESLQKLNFSLL
jgi:glycosyltransferase involved in cell wall biosynthesis